MRVLAALLSRDGSAKQSGSFGKESSQNSTYLIEDVRKNAGAFSMMYNFLNINFFVFFPFFRFF